MLWMLFAWPHHRIHKGGNRLGKLFVGLKMLSWPPRFACQKWVMFKRDLILLTSNSRTDTIVWLVLTHWLRLWSPFVQNQLRELPQFTCRLRFAGSPGCPTAPVFDRRVRIVIKLRLKRWIRRWPPFWFSSDGKINGLIALTRILKEGFYHQILSFIWYALWML